MTTKPTGLSEKEIQILAFSWQCFKGGAPDIDYEKLCGLVGHTNPKSTANSMASIKKKLAALVDVPKEGDGAEPATNGGNSPVKKLPAKRGRPRKTEEANEVAVKKETTDNDSMDAGASTGDEAQPAKKRGGETKKGGAIPKKAIEEPVEDGTEDAELSEEDV